MKDNFLEGICICAGVIGGVIAFVIAHVAKLVLDWVAAKTGFCTGANSPPVEVAEDFHVTPKDEAKKPATTAPVSHAYHALVLNTSWMFIERCTTRRDRENPDEVVEVAYAGCMNRFAVLVNKPPLSCIHMKGRCPLLKVDMCSVMVHTLDFVSFACQVQDSAHGGVEMANGGIEMTNGGHKV